MKQRPNRGIALAIVLMITFILVVLTGAFVGVNSTNLQQLSSSINRSNAEEACSSAMQYAWMRLDQDAGWAAPGYFTTNPADEYWPKEQGPDARVRAHGSGTRITGTIRDTEMTFAMDVFNNIANDSADLVNRVPARGVRLSIDGQANGVRKHFDVVLRQKAFVDASAVSNQNMAVVPAPGEDTKWTLESTDELLNMIRSNATISGPSAGIGGGTSQIEFAKPAGAPVGAVGPFGTAWAKGDILMDLVNLSASAENLNTATTKAKGQFLPRTGASYEVPVLGPEDLNGPTTERILPGGRYDFKIAGAKIAGIAGQEAVPETPAVPDVLDPVTGEVLVPGTPALPGAPAVAETPGFTQWKQSLVYTDLSGTEHILKEVQTGDAPEGDDAPKPLDKDDWIPLALDPQTGQRTDHGVMANLRTGQIIVAPGVKAVVPTGNLTVGGQIGSGNLGLGVVVKTSKQEEDQEKNKDYDEGKKSDKDKKRDKDNEYRKGDTKKEKPPEVLIPATLELTNGSLDIYGAATGWGSIVAREGGMTLRLKSALETDPSFGVAMYAGQNIVMKPAHASFGIMAKDADFSGLVYTKGDFLVLAERQKLSIEGALVSNGGIYINNAEAVNFKYNPNYLYDIISSGTRTSTRLEQVSFTMR